MKPKHPIETGKISKDGAGLGTLDRGLVLQRARELAIADGRTANDVNEKDWQQALTELQGTNTDGPPELPAQPQTVQTRVWEPEPGTAGKRGLRQELDDEQSVAEKLIEGGMAEAEHDERVEAGKQTAQERDEE